MHAEIARELAVSRDPFALTLSGVRYVDKPPLLYALLAGVFTVAGPSEAAARAVSAGAALAAIGATAWLGARLLGAASGTLAGLALATSVGFFAYARYVRPETLFVAALAAGFALALVGLREARRPLVVAGLGAFGLAGLAKDPLGAVAPPLAVGAALALAGRARPLGRWLPGSGAAACAALGFGWWLFAEWRTPGFTWYTVIDNHVLNVVGARQFPDEDVSLTVLEFLAIAALGAVPWVLPAGLALASLARRRAWRDPDELPWTVLGLWTVGVLGATALSAFRLPHYGLPAYPALALLAARGWREYGGRGLALAHVAVLGALAAGCAVAWRRGAPVTREVMTLVDVATRKTLEAGTRVPPWAELTAPFAWAAVALGLGALALAAWVLASRDQDRGRWPAPAWLVAGTMIGLAPAVVLGLARVAEHRAVRDLAAEVGRRAETGDLVVHEGPLENSGAFEWYAGRRPVLLEGRRSVLGFAARRAEGRDAFWDEERLRRAWQSGRRVWVVTTRSPARSRVAGWPGSRLVAAAGGRALYANGPEPAGKSR